jgi:condensin-2 complex subunit G2
MTVGEVIKSLLRAVEEEGKDDHSCQPLIRLVSKNPKAVVSSLKEIPKKQAKRFFSSLKNLTDVILQEEAYVPESDKEDENEITPDKKSSECLLFLKYAAMFVQGFLEGRIAAAKEKQTVNKNTKKPLKVLPEVYDVALDLHNILFSLATCGPDASHTQSAILKVCQTFWLHNCEHRETVIAQCLPLLVFQTCDDDAQFPTIKSLHKLKDAFAVIDFTNPSSDSLRSLLLKLASNPLCLKLPEGKKFLATLLQDKDLCRDLHLAFRAQIPQTKKNILQAYGEIYHRAWKEALVEHEEDEEEEGEEINMNNARMIEHEALQDLMHASIHVAAPATLKSILSVLETLFQDKKNAQTAELLYRLYNPIIWRSLGFANPMIRKNAIVILEKVFPLNNPSTVNQTKEAIEKAAEALKNALQDRHPMVRIAAAQATCNICTVYWETLPATEIRMLLNRKYLFFVFHDAILSWILKSQLDYFVFILQTLSWDMLRTRHRLLFESLHWKPLQNYLMLHSHMLF